jgi:hypothetical protein
VDVTTVNNRVRKAELVVAKVIPPFNAECKWEALAAKMKFCDHWVITAEFSRAGGRNKSRAEPLSIK